MVSMCWSHTSRILSHIRIAFFLVTRAADLTCSIWLSSKLAPLRMKSVKKGLRIPAAVGLMNTGLFCLLVIPFNCETKRAGKLAIVECITNIESSLDEVCKILGASSYLYKEWNLSHHSNDRPLKRYQSNDW